MTLKTYGFLECLCEYLKFRSQLFRTSTLGLCRAECHKLKPQFLANSFTLKVLSIFPPISCLQYKSKSPWRHIIIKAYQPPFLIKKKLKSSVRLKIILLLVIFKFVLGLCSLFRVLIKHFFRITLFKYSKNLVLISILGLQVNCFIDKRNKRFLFK